ncbi:hypothetical protein O1611_g2269 [Lasiodiplodia mahajangana]|uniref:Uncharacterized protein n=1 Tax=Lasiodiplodia mahajangana TaxID=1108764 RepID=A0ACC2JV17_9PEZI|nr:hypothetical protein O1611_g2269 [Lasiodiplodia mahajangana]
MEDAPPSVNPGGDPENPEAPRNRRQGMLPEDGSSAISPTTNPSKTSAFQGQYQPVYTSPLNTFPNQTEQTHYIQGPTRQGVYDMNAMTNALPQAGYRYSGGHQHRYTPGPNMIPQMVQFPSQPHIPQLANQQYYISQHQQIPQYYSPMSPTTQQHPHYQIGSPRGGIGIGYYSNSVMMNQAQVSAPGYQFHPSNQYPAQNASIHHQLMQPQYFVPPESSAGGPGDSSPLIQRNHDIRSLGGFVSNEAESAGNRPNVVRGPPRKPRQSGHAIWIGNLPPQTELMSLVYHVCKEATGLESLFLIAKSNCAFANFKDEASCIAAQQKLHDSKFQSVRLVSRLRKNTVEGTSGQTAPTGPAAILPSNQTLSSDRTPSSPPTKTQEDTSGSKNTQSSEEMQHRDKFFILKSLTVEDLDLSIQTGVWATQAHNEEALNKAFGVADNVYLIFSANKSGEYFGYARMISAIDDDPAAAIEFAPRAQVTNSMDLPKAIPTEATETCPRGRIIDDSARGTIFWEVEREEVDGVSDTISEAEDSESAKGPHDGEGGSKAWGKPFKLEWLSTTRLPFYRTRGLRNPWNSHREVKIARDGTELEPEAGRRLIGLFNHRVQSPIPVTTMGMTTGFPPPPHFH